MNDRPSRAPSPDRRSARPQDKTVLIIEDDQSMLDLLGIAVRGEGFRVESASDGIEAVEKMRRLKPDLAVMDLMLPRYGGLEMLYELSTRETAAIPVIVVTGRRIDVLDAEKIRALPNVVEFFEKPVKLKLFVDALHRTLGTLP